MPRASPQGPETGRATKACVNKSECKFGCAGPANELEPVLVALEADEKFVRRLDTRGIPYHSPPLASLGPALRSGKHRPVLVENLLVKVMPYIGSCNDMPKSAQRGSLCNREMGWRIVAHGVIWS